MRQDAKPEGISRKELKRAGYAAVRRLAHFMRLKHLETMSDKQVPCLVWWRLSRADKRRRGLILNW